jgi:cell division protein YceG involved in septum cleavage
MSVVIDNLVSAGLITDRAAFEQYLNERNLVTKINIGEYQLSQDMGYEVIADMITLE